MPPKPKHPSRPHLPRLRSPHILPLLLLLALLTLLTNELHCTTHTCLSRARFSNSHSDGEVQGGRFIGGGSVITFPSSGSGDGDRGGGGGGLRGGEWKSQKWSVDEEGAVREDKGQEDSKLGPGEVLEEEEEEESFVDGVGELVEVVENGDGRYGGKGSEDGHPGSGGNEVPVGVAGPEYGGRWDGVGPDGQYDGQEDERLSRPETGSSFTFDADVESAAAAADRGGEHGELGFHDPQPEPDSPSSLDLPNPQYVPDTTMDEFEGSIAAYPPQDLNDDEEESQDIAIPHHIPQDGPRRPHPEGNREELAVPGAQGTEGMLKAGPGDSMGMGAYDGLGVMDGADLGFGFR